MKGKILSKIDKTLQLGDDFMKLGDLLDQHLKPLGDDLTLLTIKGHLIIESLLEMNLCRILTIDELPKKYGRLDFNQKLQLVQTVIKQSEPGPDSPNSDLCLAIDKLNFVRNQLAHNLKNPIEIEKDVKDFIKEYQLRANTKSDLGQTTARQLDLCIRKLCEFLCRVRFHFFKTVE